jgi:hypothetical protein
MPDLIKKTTARLLPLTGTINPKPIAQLRQGMPAIDSIHSTLQFKPKSGGRTYTILRTTEVDNYETNETATALSQLAKTKEAVPEEIVAEAARKKVAHGDDFGGTDRKASKLSIGSKSVEKFSDLSKLIASLVADDKMIAHKPKISTAADSGRTQEEQRNVSVTAFLYASSRETDNDFHLIIGRKVKAAPEMYMASEVSGLPPNDSPAFAKLNAARNSFKDYFGDHLPGAGYDFYDPPIPVKIEGSLFFDMTHAKGSHPGPQSLKSRIPTIWEIHPVTSIKLG